MYSVESKFLDIINSLKNIPKPFLLMLACLPWVLSISYVQEIIPPLSKYMEESPTVVPVMWMVSIASILLLFFELCVFIIGIFKAKRVKKIENNRIKNEKMEMERIQIEKREEANRIRLAEEKRQEQKEHEEKIEAENRLLAQRIAKKIKEQEHLDNIIMSFINMSNDAKRILCDLYETHPRGEAFMRSHGANKSKTIVLDELCKIEFLKRTYVDTDRYGLNFRYLINPIYYDFFNKNPDLYQKIKKSIPVGK